MISTCRNKPTVTGIIFVIIIMLLSPVVSPLAAATVYNNDGSLNETVFAQEWRKYSDLDEAIPGESRSWEAQQYYDNLYKINQLQAEIFLIQRDMELDRLNRLALKEYKSILTTNLQANLLRSFWRLAWITYGVIKGGVSAGRAYSKILNLNLSSQSGAISAMGQGLVMIEAMDSAIDDNTQSIRSRIDRSLLVGEAKFIASLGDPKKTAMGLFVKTMDQAGQAILPTANLTEADFNLLREQHLLNRELDKALALSYLENRERRKRVESLLAEIEALRAEMARWEEAEKLRVKDMLLTNVRESPSSEDPNQEPVTQGEQSTQPVVPVPVVPGYAVTYSGSYDVSSWGASGINENWMKLQFNSGGSPVTGQGKVSADFNYGNGMTSQTSYVFSYTGNYDASSQSINGSFTVTVQTLITHQNGSDSYNFNGSGAISALVQNGIAKGSFTLPKNEYGSGGMTVPFQLNLQP